ncbi:MAG: 3-deoxy-7-phosphoheptulonate synthase [Oscillospiraceae bacterium]|nr:3-deoxy-7-phosphoheptulonate synthase [Oscillospiraceae bacterium]
MVIVLKSNAAQESVKELLENIKAKGLDVNVSEGHNHTIVGLIGDTSRILPEDLQSIDIVDSVKRISEPYKKANRKMHPEDSLIDVSGKLVGEGIFHVIAGPCSVESEEQIIEVARDVQKSGATMLRGGAFKPRTSPYAFQGLHNEGIRLLLEAKKATGLPIVTEIMNASHLDLFADVDVIQVGARNMQNFELLKELGHSNKPILLKRGLANTIEEWLMSAEYIMAGGNNNVILCERGIRTFETATRNTLDISAVPVLKEKTHLPVIIDPSHATGKSALVAPLAKTAVASGADGLMIEVHNNPAAALCDGAQSLNPKQFDELMADIKRRVEFEGKTL